MPCRRQSQVSTQSYAREKARGQASRQQACGSLRAEPSIGEAESKATNKISWANKATVYKHDKHSKFFDKRAGNSQKNQRGAQTQNKRSPFGARRIARDIQPNSDSVFGGRTRRHSRVTVQRISMSKSKAQNSAGGREGDHPKEENFQPENASSPSDKDAHHAHQQGRGQQIQPSTPKKPDLIRSRACVTILLHNYLRHSLWWRIRSRSAPLP